MRARKYSEEFKEEAVRLVVETGRSGNSVAKEVGISQTVLARWVRERKTRGRADGTKSDLELENERLRKELAVAKKEVDFLRESAAYFASLKR